MVQEALKQLKKDKEGLSGLEELCDLLYGISV
jgi:hypothetical protein